MKNIFLIKNVIQYLLTELQLNKVNKTNVRQLFNQNDNRGSKVLIQPLLPPCPWILLINPHATLYIQKKV